MGPIWSYTESWGSRVIFHHHYLWGRGRRKKKPRTDILFQQKQQPSTAGDHSGGGYITWEETVDDGWFWIYISSPSISRKTETTVWTRAAISRGRQGLQVKGYEYGDNKSFTHVIYNPVAISHINSVSMAGFGWKWKNVGTHRVEFGHDCQHWGSHRGRGQHSINLWWGRCSGKIGIWACSPAVYVHKNKSVNPIRLSATTSHLSCYGISLKVVG